MVKFLMKQQEQPSDDDVISSCSRNWKQSPTSLSWPPVVELSFHRRFCFPFSGQIPNPHQSITDLNGRKWVGERKVM